MELKLKAWDKKNKRWLIAGKHEHNFTISDEGSLAGVGFAWNGSEDPKDFDIILYTGRKDKDNTEIFDGDIIEFDAKEWGSGNNVFVVEWDNENSCWSFGGGTASDMGFRKVIGNIYENPELLNKEDK